MIFDVLRVTRTIFKREKKNEINWFDATGEEAEELQWE